MERTVPLPTLTPEHLHELTESLVRLRDALSLRLSEVGEEAPVSLDAPIGRLSRIDAIQAQQIARSQKLRGANRVQIINAALARLRQGTYGECLRCGEPVGLERLRVSPEVTLCRECSQTTER